jgi:hypothetical protein
MSVIIPGKIIYICNARVGSYSIVDVLKSIPGSIVTQNHHDPLTDHAGDEVVVCSVRNHFDTIASWWAHMGMPEDFGAWIRNFDYHPHVTKDRLFALAAHRYHSFIRFENMEYDLYKLFVTVGLPATFQIPKLNVTKGKIPKELLFDSKSAKAVVARFGEEMEEYGYL